MLTLYDELYMLSVHEDKGTYIKSVVDRVKPGLVGAVLAELALMGKIQTNDNHRLVIIDNSPTDDDLLDEALKALGESEKDRKFGYWISHLNDVVEKHHKQIVERLSQMGVLYQENDHLEWATPTPLKPDLNASSKFWLRRHIRGVVFAQEEVEQRDIALLSLIRACGLLDLVFLKDERRFASRHINELVVSVAMKSPVAQTIEEIESAIAVVVEDE
jgi:golgi phosphoprotein 3